MVENVAKGGIRRNGHSPRRLGCGTASYAARCHRTLTAIVGAPLVAVPEMGVKVPRDALQRAFTSDPTSSRDRPRPPATCPMNSTLASGCAGASTHPRIDCRGVGPYVLRSSREACYLSTVGAMEDYRRSISNRVLHGKTEQDIVIEPMM